MVQASDKAIDSDNKKDVLINMGGCGTGGCLLAIFLNEFDDYYHLAFLEYLKNYEFTEDQNKKLSIINYEEVEPYNPSKLYVTKFTLKKNKYQLDTTFIQVDN